MPLQSKQNVIETDWTNYDVEGIPVYEKCFNRLVGQNKYILYIITLVNQPS